MADDWAGLSAQLGKMQQAWYVAARSYWSVFDQGSDTATIVSEDGSTRQVPSWRAITNFMGSKADKATTLAGYGITDAAPIVSPTIQSLLKVRTSGGNLEVLYPNISPGVRLFARDDSGSMIRIEIQGRQVIFPNQTGVDGFVFDSSTGSVRTTGVVMVGSYTRATLPAPSAFPGGICFVADIPAHAFSSGTQWRIYPNPTAL